MRRKQPAVDCSVVCGRCQGSGAVSLQQHDAPHRPAGDALDACQQFRLGRQSAAAVVARRDVAQGARDRSHTIT